MQAFCDTLLDNAIQSLDGERFTSFANHWRGTGSLNAGSGASTSNARCIAIEYTRLAVADFDQAVQGSDPGAIDAAIARLGRLATKLDLVLNIDRETIRSRNPNIAAAMPLCHAITHTMLAAISTKVSFPSTYRETTKKRQQNHLAEAFQLYEKHWGLGLGPVPNGIGIDRFETNAIEGLLRNAMRVFGAKGISVSTWLTLHALLSRVLHVATPQVDFANTMRVLTAARIDGVHHGVVFPIGISRIINPSLRGVYIDPMSFGITRLNDEFLESIRMSYDCCHQQLLAHNNQHVSFCLTANASDTKPDVAAAESIGGRSAGGLIAAGFIATAQNRSLNASRSATCQLQLARPIEVKSDNNILGYRNLRLEPIGSIHPKIRSALEYGITGVALCARNAADYNSGNPNSRYPEIRAVGNLHELVEWLCLREDSENLIRAHCTSLHSAWDAAAKAENGDANPDFDHRFAFYVPPQLFIEGPTNPEGGIDPKARTKDQSRPSLTRQVFPIAGDSGSDEALLKLIAFAYRNDEFLDAPEWLHTRCKTVIYDNAGAGKTVCSHRIKHLLSDHRYWRRLLGNGSPPLVVRIEDEWPSNKHGHNLTLREALIHWLGNGLVGNVRVDDDLLADTVNQALITHRVVIIVDGFDQFSTAHQQHIADLINEAERDASNSLYNCRWFVTSRVHALEEHAPLFAEDRWTRVRIEPFSTTQQDRYFELAGVSERWKSMVDRQSMAELLGLPMVLRMLVEFIELTTEQTPLPIFESESQLALVTTRLLLARALDRNTDRATGLVKTRIGKSIDFPVKLTASQQLTLLEHVLTVMAFECRVRPENSYQIQGDDPCFQFLKSCQQRFFTHALNNQHGANYFTEECWEWAVEVLKTIELNHRSVTERFAEERIAFRSLKMVECHAARYLTRYATETDVFGPDNRSNDAKQPFAWQFISEERWKRTWELAIDMPSEKLPGGWPEAYKHAIDHAIHDPLVTCRSLSVLFRPTLDQSRRHTELIYRCWPLFEYDIYRSIDSHYRVDGTIVTGETFILQGKKSELERTAKLQLLGERGNRENVRVMRTQCLNEFRKPAQSLVREIESRLDTVCIERPGFVSWLKRKLGFKVRRVPIPADETTLKQVLKKWRRQSSLEKSLTFLQCPPQSWIQAYEENSDSISDPRINNAIKNRETTPVTPFQMQATPVTQRMFALFDKNAIIYSSYTTADGYRFSYGDLNIYHAISPFGSNREDFPMYRVSWYDGFAFSKFLGQEYRLPTAFEWEHAARGGTKTAYHFGDRWSFDLLNCMGEYDYYGDFEKLQFDPSRKDSTGLKPVGLERYPCNPFGLFDIHGNVSEWCFELSATGHFLARGGAWIDKAEDCTFERDFYFCFGNFQGIRVARSASEIQKTSVAN